MSHTECLHREQSTEFFYAKTMPTYDLTKKGFDLGLVTQSRLDRLNEKLNYVERLTQFFIKTSAIPEEVNPILERLKASQISQKMKLVKLVSRPQVDFSSIERLQSVQQFLLENGEDREAIQQTIIQIKYSGYINREKRKC